MELTKLCMVIMALFMSSSMWVMSTTAESSSSNGCNSVIITLAPCLDYIEGKASSPSSSCCTQLGGVVKTQPQCLCDVMNGSSAPAGVKIDKTKAMALPSACKVQAPLSQCSGATGGASISPSGSPVEKSPSTSLSTSEEGGSNAEATSPPPSHSSAGNMMYSPMHTITTVLLFIFSHALNLKAF